MRAVSTLLRLDAEAREEATDEEWEALETHHQERLASARRRGWSFQQCGHCRGHGVVSGDNFYAGYGPDECPTCCGAGSYWVSLKGRIADYPGGPLRGML